MSSIADMRRSGHSGSILLYLEIGTPERVRAMADLLPDAAERVAALARSSGLSAPIIDRLATALARHARNCGSALG